MDPNSAIHSGVVASQIIGTITNIVCRSQKLTEMIGRQKMSGSGVMDPNS